MTVLLFVTVVALVAGIGFGVAPALQVSGANLVEATQESRVRRQRGRAALVVAEVALSLMLLAGAGLMIRSFVKLQNLDLGFTSENVLTAQLFLPGNRYPAIPGNFGPLTPGVTPQLSKASAFYARLMETLAATPGIESVGAVSSLPLNPVGIDYDLPVDRRGPAAAACRARSRRRISACHAGLLPHHAHRAEAAAGCSPSSTVPSPRPW